MNAQAAAHAVIAISLSVTAWSAPVLAARSGAAEIFAYPRMQEKAECFDATTEPVGHWMLDDTFAKGNALVLRSTGRTHAESGARPPIEHLPASDRLFANGFDAPHVISGGAEHRH